MGDKKRLRTIVYIIAGLFWLVLAVWSDISIWKGIIRCILMVLLIFCSESDLKLKKIKNKYLLYALLGSLIVIIGQWIDFLFITNEFARSVRLLTEGLTNSLISMVIWLVAMLILSFITRHSIGYGDVKLFALIAFFMGSKETIFIFTAAFLVAGIAAVVLLCKGERKAKVPLAPCIMAGFYIYTVACMYLEIIGVYMYQ